MATMGRPKKELNWEEFERLCGLHCTLSDIAGWFGVSEDTIERRVKEDHGITFAEYFKKHAALGKTSLRRLQWESAQKGNVTMLIWLGKQLLNQTDRIDTSHLYPTPIVVERLNGTQVMLTAKAGEIEQKGKTDESN